MLFLLQLCIDSFFCIFKIIYAACYCKSHLPQILIYQGGDFVNVSRKSPMSHIKIRAGSIRGDKLNKSL